MSHYPEPVKTRTAGHTKLPWRAHGPDEIGDYLVASADEVMAIAAVVQNGFRSKAETAANAAFIVQAVNSYASYEAMKEALRKLADAVETERRTYEDHRRLFDQDKPIPADNVIEHTGNVFDAAYASTNDAVKSARAALKEADRTASHSTTPSITGE